MHKLWCSLKFVGTWTKSLISYDRCTAKGIQTLLRHIKTPHLRKEVIWWLTYAVKWMITNDCVQGFFQKTRITFINESLAKKWSHLALATEIPGTFAKAYFRQIRCFCDCVHNVLQGKVTLLLHQKQKLRLHKNKLWKLADRKVTLKIKRRIIQKGRFLPLWLSALAPVINGVVGTLIKWES